MDLTTSQRSDNSSQSIQPEPFSPTYVGGDAEVPPGTEECQEQILRDQGDVQLEEQLEEKVLSLPEGVVLLDPQKEVEEVERVQDLINDILADDLVDLEEEEPEMEGENDLADDILNLPLVREIVETSVQLNNISELPSPKKKRGSSVHMFSVSGAHEEWKDADDEERNSSVEAANKIGEALEGRGGFSIPLGSSHDHKTNLNALNFLVKACSSMCGGKIPRLVLLLFRHSDFRKEVETLMFKDYDAKIEKLEKIAEKYSVLHKKISS